VNAGPNVEAIMQPPTSVNWKQVAADQQEVLAGLLIVMKNRMIPDQLREAVLLGAIQGQLEFITATLGYEPSQVNCVLQAINIQRGAIQRESIF
jgi:hypothetical protein